MTSRWAIAVGLDPPPGGTGSWMPEVVVDLIWARARTADGLDHVRATTDLIDRPEIVLILRAGSEADALDTATALHDRCRHCPALRDWTLRSLDVLPLSDLIDVPRSHGLS